MPIDMVAFAQFLGNVLLLVLIVYMVRRTFPARNPSLEEQFEPRGETQRLREELKAADLVLKSEANDRFRGISAKIDALRAETRGDIALLRTEITQREDAQQRNYQALISAVGELRGEMKNRSNGHA